MVRTIVLAIPRGFCAGVKRAINIIEKALHLYGPPVYCRKEIVHNSHVVEDFLAKGVIFVNELDQVPQSATVIFSAHGVAPKVREEARKSNLNIIDATCPLVTKVHNEVNKYAKDNNHILLIGHKTHDEVIGIIGEAPSKVEVIENIKQAESIKVQDPSKVAVLTQTTLSLDDTSIIIDSLKNRFPHLQRPNKADICYATQNRQTAVKDLAKETDIILVIGSINSSNSNRLVEVANQNGTSAKLINDTSDINPEWFTNTHNIGITAGASTPEFLVEKTVSFLRTMFEVEIRYLTGVEEDIEFAVPRLGK